MLFYAALTVLLTLAYARPRAEPAPPVSSAEARQLLYYGGLQNAQQILLEPQYPLPAYNFINEKQSFPRVQAPQFTIYLSGAPPGQQFLLQPATPPGNFLLPQPQPGPGVVLRDGPPRPIFIAGYPKPAHIPPVEKDAEEIPTDPAKIPKPEERKPEKLETFNEPEKNENSNKPIVAGEQDALAAADRNPNLYPKKVFPGINDLKPGQRFFILNGEQLFPSYPVQPLYNPQPQTGTRFVQNLPIFPQNQATLPQQEFPPFGKSSEPERPPLNQLPLAFFIRNSVTGQIDDVKSIPNSGQFNLDSKLSQNYVSLNQPQQHKEPYVIRTSVPIHFAQSFQKDTQALPEQIKSIQKVESKDNENDPQINPLKFYDSSYYQYQYDKANAESIDDSVVIDAKYQNDNKDDDSESEAITAQKVEEPSLSQAQPGAIALAGPGGVAASAPRGTALVGQGGVAVSSPQATAVAGPSKDEDEAKKMKNKNNNRKEK